MEGARAGPGSIPADHSWGARGALPETAWWGRSSRGDNGPLGRLNSSAPGNGSRAWTGLGKGKGEGVPKG